MKQKRGRFLQHGFTASVALFAAFAVQISVAERRNIPTYERDVMAEDDLIVSRGHSDIAVAAYKTGTLGILLPSYNRSALYLAYRALVLGHEETVRQSGMKFEKEPYRNGDPGDVNDWLRARGQFTTKLLPHKIEVNAPFGNGVYGWFINCGNPAFVLASATLKSLQSNKKYSQQMIQEWVNAQDAVFELCDSPPGASVPAFQELPAGAD
ncbi:MAG: hypothetical protein ABUL58_04415, partial [Steroidobacter sp.]